MPDPIKDLYQSVKSSGLFLDEQDFREQLQKSPKAVYSVVAKDKNTSALFLDYSDFENALNLKKKESASPAVSRSSATASSSPSAAKTIDEVRSVEAPEGWEDQKAKFEQSDVPDDPIGNQLRPIRAQKKALADRTRGVDNTYVPESFRGLSEQANTLKQQEKELTAIELPTTQEAKEALNTYVQKANPGAPDIDQLSPGAIRELLPQNNLTARQFLQQYERDRTTRTALQAAGETLEGTIQNPRKVGRELIRLTNPELDKKLTALENGQSFEAANYGAGYKALMEKEGLNAIGDFLDKNPELPESLKDDYQAWAKDYKLRNFEETAASVRQKIGQKLYEKAGFGSSIYRGSPSQKEIEEAFEELKKEGQFDSQDEQIFKTYVQPLEKRNIGTDIPMSGFLNKAGEGIVKGMQGTANLLRSDDERRREETDKAFDTRYGSVKHKDWFSELMDGMGDLTGQVAWMALSSKGIGGMSKMAGLNTLAKNEAAQLWLSSFANTYDSHAKEALEAIPDDKNKGARRLYAFFMTGLEAASEGLFKDPKVIDAFKKSVAPELATFAKGVSTGYISKKAAQTQLANILQEKLTPFAKNFTKESLKNATEEAILEPGKALADAIIAGKPVNGGEVAASTVGTFVQTLMYSPVVAAAAAHTDTKRPVFEKVLYEVASNPKKYTRQIAESKSLDPTFPAEQVQSNLDAASKVVKDLEATQLTTRQKEKYLLHSLNEKVLNDKLEATTDSVLKDRIKEQIAESKAEREKILFTRAAQVEAKQEKDADKATKTEIQADVPQETIVPEPQQEIAVQENEPFMVPEQAENVNAESVTQNTPAGENVAPAEIPVNEINETYDFTTTPQPTEALQPQATAENPEGIQTTDGSGTAGATKAGAKPDFDTFRTYLMEDVVRVKDSSFDWRVTMPLTQAEREGAIKDIQAGKQTKRRETFEKALQEMYDSGVVYVNRGRGNQAQSEAIPIEDWFREPLDQREIEAADTISDDAASLIESEGITLDNLHNFKHLFDGFPYTQEDYTAIQEYLSGQSQGNATTQTVSEGSQTIPPASEPTPAEEGSVKKTVTTKRAYEGAFREEVRRELENLGLTREVENQQQAARDAKTFVDSVGEEAALAAVRAYDIDGGRATAVYADVIKRLENRLLDETDPETVQALAKQQAALIDEMGERAKKSGQYNAMFDYIYQTSDLGFNVEKKIEEYKAVNKGEIPKEVEEKFRALEKEFKALQKEIAEERKRVEEAEKRAAEAEARLVIENIQEDIARSKKKPEPKAKKEYAQKALDAIGKVREKIKANAYSDVTGMVAIVDSGLAAIEGAIKAGIQVSAAIEKGIRTIKKALKEQGVDVWEKEDQFRRDMTDAFTEAGIERDKSERNEAGRIVVPKALIRNLVEEGFDNIHDLTEAVHAIVKQDIEDATIREVRDAITDYGKTVNPSKDEIEAQIRKIRRVGRIVSALEDVAEKKRPLRSGLQRDKLDAEERALQKELREAMKDLPLDDETAARELKTYLDAQKTRLRNRIEDLRRAREKKERIPKNERTPIQDKEIEDLREELEWEQALYDEMFGERPLTDGEKKINALQNQLDRLLTRDSPEAKEKPQYTPEEDAKIRELKEEIQEAKIRAGLVPSKRTQEQIDLDALDRAIEENERRIREVELEAKGKEPRLSTPAIEAKKSRLKETRDVLKKMREAAGISLRKRIKSAETRAERRIEQLEKMRDELRKGNMSVLNKPQRAQLKSDRLTKLNAEKLRIQEEYEKEFYKAKLRNRTKAEKVKDSLWELWGLTRALQATGEFSFIGVQGLIQTIAHPVHAAKAFKNALRFFTSESRAENWLREIKSQEWYPVLKESRLALSEPHAEVTAREEMFFSGWTNVIWNTIGTPLKFTSKDAYQKWVNANPFKALERAAVGYLDTIRVERFLDGMQILEEKKAQGVEVTKQDYKDVADAINTLTGRASLGFAEPVAKGLTKIFFSPRNWASAIKTATPYALYHFGKMTPTARKMALADFGKFVGFTTSLVMAAAAYYNNDDDEETGVEFDPRSSDFGKIKLGNTRVDPWGGRIQLIVTQARLIMHAVKNAEGDIVPLGTPYKAPTRKDLVIKMAANKLAPSAAMLNKYMSTRLEDGERVDEFGQPYDFEAELKEHLLPIYWGGTVPELLQDDPNALDGVLLFAAFFGLGVQVYEEKK